MLHSIKLNRGAVEQWVNALFSHCKDATQGLRVRNSPSPSFFSGTYLEQTRVKKWVSQSMLAAREERQERRWDDEDLFRKWNGYKKG